MATVIKNLQRPLHNKVLDAVTLAAARTSSAIDVRGFNQLTLYFNLSAHTTATDVFMNVEVSDDQGTTWFRVQELDTSSPPTLTSGDALWSLAVSGADTWVWNVPINYDFLRIVVDGTSGAAGDVLTVTGRLGVL